MKFLHMADCHIGGWRDEALRRVNEACFCWAVEYAIAEEVAFVLIAGDLFNTALPPMDGLKTVTKKLKELNEQHIPVYAIAGSHDYSPSGKTMLDVLEKAGLLIMLPREKETDGKIMLDFVADKKTGVKLAGLLGLRGGLEKSHYENLSREHLEKEAGQKIFLFHSAIDELKPDELRNVHAGSVSLLPRGFDYYAGGHVHITAAQTIEGYKNVVYPGPTYPNSFSELEKLGGGSVVLVDDFVPRHVQIPIGRSCCIVVDCSGKTSAEASNLMNDAIDAADVIEKVVLVRLTGMLSSGSPSDIRVNDAIERAKKRGALTVLRNTAQLSTTMFDEVHVAQASAEDIEEKIVQEHIGQTKTFAKEKEEAVIHQLMNILSSEKGDGERQLDYEQRVVEAVKKTIA